jgi:hypothetical protein
MGITQGFVGIDRHLPRINGEVPLSGVTPGAAEAEQQFGPFDRRCLSGSLSGSFQVGQRVFEGGHFLSPLPGHQKVTKDPLTVRGQPGLQEVVGDGHRLWLETLGVYALQGFGRLGVEPSAARGRELGKHRLADQLVSEDEPVLARAVVDGDKNHGPFSFLNEVEQVVLGHLHENLKQLEREDAPQNRRAAQHPASALR